MLTSLRTLEQAIRASWCLWTADPADHYRWTEGNPASGQCAVTALVIQDLFGGELIEADVRRGDGTPAGFHYWNRLHGGAELDLTREQFRLGQSVLRPRAVPRAPDVTRGRLAGQYHLLSARLTRALAGVPPPPPRAVRLAGVCLEADAGPPLTCRDEAGAEGELPGGSARPGERFDRTLEALFAARMGFAVEARHVLAAVCGEPGDALVVYECLRRP